MTYLDYFTYIILLGLFLLLVNKIVLNDSSSKEGFVAAKEEKRNYDKNGIEIIDPDKPKNPDSNWLILVKLIYNVSAEMAYILIKMPYKFLKKGVEMVIDIVKNLNDMLKPIRKFATEMYRLFKNIGLKVVTPFIKSFKQIFKIFGNLPKFIQENAEMVINMITEFLEQIIRTFKTVFDLIKKVWNLLIKLPTMIFTLLNQIITMVFNIIVMLIKLPESLMGMIINLQEQGMMLMDKPIKIPFMDLFFG